MIRDAAPSDLEAVTALYSREVLGGTATFELDPPSLTAMTARFNAVRDKGLPWLVAEVDGAFVGYAYVAPFRLRPAYRYGVEGSIYLEETARGRGVGGALLAALVERSRALGLRHVIGAISDSETSQASIALHSRLGFRPVGTYQQVGWKFDRWIDVHLMQLDLDPTGAPPLTPGINLTDGIV